MTTVPRSRHDALPARRAQLFRVRVCLCVRVRVGVCACMRQERVCACVCACVLRPDRRSEAAEASEGWVG